MNEERDLDELGARLARMLHAIARPPAPGMADRLLSRTAAAPQRLGSTLFAPLASAAAVTAVTLAAMVVGVALGGLPGLGGQAPNSPPGSDLASRTAPPTANPTQASGAPMQTVPPSPVATGSVDEAVPCTNPDDGYRVEVPSGWYVNEMVEGQGGDHVAACRFFSPVEFEVRPASEASGIAIAIRREATPPRAEGVTTTIAGREATIVERVSTTDGFDPAGTRYYEYWIDAGTDWLVVATSDGPNWLGDYDENKAVLDGMVRTLQIVAS